MNRISYYLFLVLILLSTVVSADISTYFIEEGKCADNNKDCGPMSRPYGNIAAVINYIVANNIPFANIVLKSGYFTGINNKNIKINNLDIQIGSYGANGFPIIDCGGIGQAFIISGGATVSMYGINLTNCSSQYGSAVFVQDSILTMDSIQINSSKSDAGSIYALNSQLTLINTTVVGNKATSFGAGVLTFNTKVDISDSILANNTIVGTGNQDNLYARDKSSVQFISALNGTTQNVFCSSSSTVKSTTGTSLCPKVRANSDSTAQNQLQQGHCGDGICDEYIEDFFSCSADCNSTNFSGFLAKEFNCTETYRTCTKIREFPQSSSNFMVMDNIDGPIKLNLTTYFKLPSDKNIYFQFNASNNLIIKVDIDRRNYINYKKSNSPSSEWNIQETSAYMLGDIVHQLYIEISTNDKSSVTNRRQFKIGYSLTNNSNYQPFEDLPFYSFNVCGDGIYDPLERCLVDYVVGYGRMDAILNTTTCGNGICDETDPNTCFTDCFQFLTEKCDPITVKKGSFIPMSTTYDTLGVLISNQITWRAPGAQHLTFGTNIVNGVQASNPIFHFSYCSEKENNIIEDVYRQTFYEVPKEISIVPLPKCTFSVTNSFWSSAAEIQESMKSSSSLDLSFDLSIKKIPKVSVEASASYSQEKTVTAASELTQEEEHTLIETSVTCSAFGVSVNEFPFSSRFLEDLSNAESLSDFMGLIKNYGTHYYTSGTLGGKLKQVTSIDKETLTVKEQNSLSQQTTYAFSATVNSPVLDVNGDYSKNTNSETDETSMNTFSKETSKTSIITYGGAPGSYGPSDDAGPTSFGDWAQSVDVSPVMVDHQLSPIRGILPEEWMTKTGKSIQGMWIQAETNYYLQALSSPLASGELGYEPEIYLWLAPSISSGSVRIEAKSKTTNKLVNRIFLSTDTKFKLGGYETVIAPPYDTQTDPTKFNTYFMARNRDGSPLDISTRSSTMYGVTGGATNERNINNLIFRKTGDTSFPTNYLFETGQINSDGVKIPVWTPYNIGSNGLLTRNTNKYGYLIIPAMPLNYDKMAINIHSGGYNYVMYISGSVSAGSQKVLAIVDNKLLGLFLTATAIDYTPNYQFLQGFSGDYNWYFADNPSRYHWFYRSTISVGDFAQMIFDNGAWGSNSIVITSKYIQKTDYDMFYISNGGASAYKDQKICGITSVSITVDKPSLFMLPNSNGDYITLEIHDSKNIFYTGASGYSYWRPGSSYSARTIYDMNGVDRDFSRDQIQKINNHDDDRWWQALDSILPSSNWIPSNVMATIKTYIDNHDSEQADTEDWCSALFESHKCVGLACLFQ